MNDEIQSLNGLFHDAFSKHYLINDKAHQIDHPEWVIRNAFDMNAALGLSIPKKLIVYVAWLHDLFAWSRSNHEQLAYEFVLNGEHPLLTSLQLHERVLVANACREHRASYKGELSSPLSELMSSADRGFDSVPDLVLRSMQYHQDKKDLSEENAYLEAVKHIQEKFGRDGYARLPTMYRHYYSDYLTTRYNTIDRLYRIVVTEKA